MAGIIGKKIGMTSVYSAEGKNLPCTLIEASPCVITQIKTEEKDGYNAVQLGYGERKDKHTTNALKGHFKKAGVSPKRKLVEFSGFEDKNLGDSVTDRNLRRRRICRCCWNVKRERFSRCC